eukprot:gene3050-3742_t
MEWGEEDSEPRLVFRSAIGNSSAALRQSRCVPFAVLGKSCQTHATPFHADYKLIIKSTRYGAGAAIIEDEEVWEVCNEMSRSGSAFTLATDPANALLRLIPWGGVAACISAGKEDTSAVNARRKREGVAYCFLPLPVETGLPVMTNGFFELSSNRRDLWQSGADMSGDGKLRADWNTSLIREVLASCYVRLLLRLRDCLGFSMDYQRFWPGQLQDVPAMWTQLVSAVMFGCKSQMLLKVHRLSTTPDLEVPLATATAGRTGDWIRCDQAMLLPSESSWSFSEEQRFQLVELLVFYHMPLVVPVSSFREVLEKYAVCTDIALPARIRTLLRTCGFSKGGAVRSPPFHLCSFLLAYCTSDLDAPTQFRDLDGLCVLPVRCGSVGTIRVMSEAQSKCVASVEGMGYSRSAAYTALTLANFDLNLAIEALTATGGLEPVHEGDGKETRGSEGVYFLCDGDEYQVFSRAQDIMLDKDLVSPTARELLGHSLVQLHSNVKLFASSCIPDLLSRVLPGASLRGKSIEMTSIGSEDIGVWMDFLREFWEYASTRPQAVTSVVESYPLLPSRRGRVLPLSRMSTYLVPRSQRCPQDVPESLVNILEKLGANIADTALIPSLQEKPFPSAFWNYVFDGRRSSLLVLLDCLQRTGDAFEAAGVTGVEREALLTHLVTSEAIDMLTDKECALIRAQLPVFKNFRSPASYCTLDKHLASSTSPKRNVVTIIDYRELDEKLFPTWFVSHSVATPQEMLLLVRLGVQALSRAEYFKSYFLPNAQTLFQDFPGQTLRAIQVLISEIGGLADRDPNLVSCLRATAFVPSGSSSGLDINVEGNKGNMQLLKCANELFDPADAELSSLLDPSFFPAAALCRDDYLVFLRAI